MDLASPRKCHHCSEELTGDLAPHLCGRCGFPQPYESGSETCFEAFGVPARFQQDLNELQVRFYQLSRALHPDRFSTSAPEFRQNSLERMSWVNQAYQTLKNRDRLRETLLVQFLGTTNPHGASTSGLTTGGLPGDLAEEWFELQEQMMEAPDQARTGASEFQSRVEERIRRQESQILEWEKQFDESQSRQALEQIQKSLKTKNYLRSLLRDVERLKARLAG